MSSLKKKDEQAKRVQGALLSYFSEHVDLVKLGGEIKMGSKEGQAMVYVGSGDHVGEELYDQFRDLVLQLPQPKGRKHRRVKFSDLECDDRFLELWPIVIKIIQPLMDVGYHPIDFFLVKRLGDFDPFHRDQFTGGDAFDRTRNKGDLFNAGAVPALRLLINVAEYGDERRYMAFRKFREEGNVLFQTEARLVAMDRYSAGNRCCSRIEHGRFGSGVTASIDFVLPRVGGGCFEGEHLANDSIWNVPWYRSVLRRLFWNLQRLPHQANDLEKKAEQEVQERAEKNSKRPCDSERHCWSCGAI